MDTQIVQPITDRAVARVEVGTYPDFDHVSVGIVVSHGVQVNATALLASTENEIRNEAIRVCHAGLVREIYGGVHELGLKLLGVLSRHSYALATTDPIRFDVEELRTLGLHLANYGKSLPKLKVRTVEPQTRQTKGRGA